jgi:hypothetical protein
MYPSPLPLVLSALLLAGLAKAHGGFFPQPPPPSPVPSYGGPQDAGPRGGGRGTTAERAGERRPAGTEHARTRRRPRPRARAAPRSAAAPHPGRALPSAAGLDADYTRWVYWWEYNKEHYLRLREPFRQDIATGSDEMFLGDSRHKAPRPDARATRDDVRLRIAPALAALLAESESRDIQTSALVALAKAARRHDDGSLERHARRLLRSGEQEVRENAVLALGVARSKAAIPAARVAAARTTAPDASSRARPRSTSACARSRRTRSGSSRRRATRASSSACSTRCSSCSRTRRPRAARSRSRS